MPNGSFQNTDTHSPLKLDTMEADSLVPKYRTRLSKLPIARGNEHLWKDSTKSTATWIGHATYYIKIKNFGILADPMFSDYASPIQLAGPKRGTPPGRHLDSLPIVNLVIISHDHYDHLDRKSVTHIYNTRKNCIFAVPLKVGSILESFGIPKNQIMEFDWWQSKSINTKAGNFRLTFVPSHHTSRRGITKESRNSTLWGSWIIETNENKKLYFAGDMAMGDGSYYQEIAKKFAPIDVSFLPIGSYKPSRYTRVHISPRQALQIHLLMQSKLSLAMHFGDFSFVFERIKDPPKDLAKARKEMNVSDSSFIVPVHGAIVPILETAMPISVGNRLSD